MSGEGMVIEPKGTMLGIAGNPNCRPVRQNKLRKRKGGNGLTLPKIRTVKGGK